jgi:hypothetical protein
MTAGESDMVIKLSTDTGSMAEQVQANLEFLTATLGELVHGFFGNPPKEKAEKITKLILGVGVRSVQRGVQDFKDVKETARKIARVVRHDYLSTACHHQRHDECRNVCKFCESECGCDCHGS